MEEAGYVTLLGDEECSSWIDRQNKLGKTKKENTPTDHYFQKLYCITVKILFSQNFFTPQVDENDSCFIVWI
jgi:hypothetical protein